MAHPWIGAHIIDWTLIVSEIRSIRKICIESLYRVLIVVPCILISIKFIHQQMHSLLNLIKFYN